MQNATGKVIRILSDERLIVSLPQENTVQVGNEIVIRGKGTAIIDPDTQETLGYANSEKARLKIEVKYDRFAICVSEPTSSDLSVLASLARPKQLRIDRTQIDPLESDNSPIVVGDIVCFVK